MNEKVAEAPIDATNNVTLTRLLSNPEGSTGRENVAERTEDDMSYCTDVKLATALDPLKPTPLTKTVAFDGTINIGQSMMVVLTTLTTFPAPFWGETRTNCGGGRGTTSIEEVATNERSKWVIVTEIEPLALKGGKRH